MGLDICVRKIVKEPQDHYFTLIDDNGNYNRNNFPEWTKPFEQETEESWYDWEKYKEETGIDVKQCKWCGESYGEDGCFMDLWPKSAGKRPEPSDFKTENSYDWEKYDKAIAEHMIRVDLEKVPTYQRKVRVLYWKEVGYQRKGLNNKFYEDYRAKRIGYFVWTKAELERYKQDYCDESYKYGEFDIYPKKYFQENIIDSFTEGEDCVIFSW